MANSVDPDETPHLRRLIRVYTVCSDLADQIHELQWLEHLWDHRKLFETWVVRATEG